MKTAYNSLKTARNRLFYLIFLVFAMILGAIFAFALFLTLLVLIGVLSPIFFLLLTSSGLSLLALEELKKVGEYFFDFRKTNEELGKLFIKEQKNE